MKALSLVFLAVLAAKGIGSLRADGHATESRRLARRLAWLRGVLYAMLLALAALGARGVGYDLAAQFYFWASQRSEEHTSELQSRLHLVCRLLLEKKKKRKKLNKLA